MKEIVEQILSFWGMEDKQLLQIYPSVWEIDRSYVIKVYDNKKQLERNIKIATILLDCNIPVAETVLTKTGEKYVAYQNFYFLMSKKLQGNNILDLDRKDKKMLQKMGCAIGKLHRALMKCEKEVEFWDNSLLEEMKGWIRETLIRNEWRIVEKAEYTKTVDQLERMYDSLPIQLIHRDVHFGNFLFFAGNLSGYIDFDLSQRNIRIFDICYFLTGLLAEEMEEAFTKNEWIESVQVVLAGYESMIPLSVNEKNAIPCVMECIEILFVAYFVSKKDLKCAKEAYRAFGFVQNCEREIKNAI